MELFEELLFKKELFSTINDEKDWFELDLTPMLKATVVSKFADAFYSTIEILEPEPDIIVFNISLYDKNGLDLAGAEITREGVYWD